MYVTGNKNDGGNNHVSLYVRIEDTESLPTGWEVDVDLKLFVHNARQRQYLTVSGMYSHYVNFLKIANKRLCYYSLYWSRIGSITTWIHSVLDLWSM